MKSPPRTRRNFVSDWDELSYLYDKIVFWFYGRQRRAYVHHRFCQNFERLLKKLCPDPSAIRGEECWALLHEVREEWERATEHRENEIRLIKKLQQAAERETDETLRNALLQGYDISDLSDRMDLLSLAYRHMGEPDKAMEILCESRRLCDENGLEFDGQDILDDILSEKSEIGQKREQRVRETSRGRILSLLKG